MMHNRKVYAKDKIGQAARDRGMDQAACQRQTQVDRLINAINDSDWRDAEVILSAFLAEYRAGPPVPALA